MLQLIKAPNKDESKSHIMAHINPYVYMKGQTPKLGRHSKSKTKVHSACWCQPKVGMAVIPFVTC